MIVGDSAGFVNVPALKGVHYAMKSGISPPRRRSRRSGPGETSWTPGALDGYDAAVRDSYIWTDLHRVRNARPAFKHGFYRGALVAGISITTLGKLPPGTKELERDAESPWRSAIGRRPTRPPTASSSSTSSRASTSPGTRPATTRRATSAWTRRCGARWPRRWAHMCPAQVYEVAGEASPAGNVVDVEVTASNCVQCGAISAKGGRLTPPEGGDGPEYTQM